MIRILNAEPTDYSNRAREILESIGEIHEANLTRDDLLAWVADFDVLIVRLGFKVDREVIDAAKRLKFVVTATTGLDHIDLEYAASKNIVIISLSGQTEFLENVRATAELTIGLALALLRNIPTAIASVRQGTWDRDLFRGGELFGKTAGIVGMGRLGTMVAGYFANFGMEILGYDPRPDFPLEAAERIVSLHELLARSDLVSLHVEYNEKTRHLMGPDEFTMMKPGAILINTSRGGIVDEAALLLALRFGHLAGAALDVLAGEPHITADNPVIAYSREHSNLLIVPHIGGNTYESLAKTEIFMAEQLRRALQKESVL
jgi:D-3-phosphoglycerate dehydrogenase